MKCRGRNTKTGKWIYKENLQDLISLEEIDLKTTGYFTEVSDLLGKEIYEGDMIWNLNENTHWVCKKSEGEYIILEGEHLSMKFWKQSQNPDKLLVEGNIFDNE